MAQHKRGMVAAQLALQFKEGSDVGRTMGLRDFCGEGGNKADANLGPGVGYLKSLRLSVRDQRATCV